MHRCSKDKLIYTLVSSFFCQVLSKMSLREEYPYSLHCLYAEGMRKLIENMSDAKRIEHERQKRHEREDRSKYSGKVCVEALEAS